MTDWKTYHKREPVLAKQLDHSIHAEAGDYLVQGPDCELYAVPRERFESMYRVDPQEFADKEEEISG